MNFSLSEINFQNKKELKSFIDLPWEIYKNDPHWVPPLKITLKDLFNTKKHPFYQTAHVAAWLLKKNNKAVGRIMAIHNYTYNQYENNKIGHFGCFECIDDLEAARLLVNEASLWLKNRGLEIILGPMNPSTNYECGILVDSFNDAPQIMMTYNPSYYETLLKKLGFRKSMDLLAYNLKADATLPKIIVDIANRVEKKSTVGCRNLDLNNWNKELDILFEIYNSAWQENWGFVPMSREEFYHSAKDLKSIVDPTLIQFAMINGIEVGFIMALPDLNQVLKKNPKGNLNLFSLYQILTKKKRINRVRVITLGIRKEYRKLGLETLLYRNLQKSIHKNLKIIDIEMSWILETNLEMNKPLIRMSGEAYKRYRLLEKDLL